MPRFFIEQGLALGRYKLQGDDFHHIRDVLRLKPGEMVTLCDGMGNDFSGKIESFQPDGVMLDLQERVANASEPPYRATLYQGLAKGDKMDTIIQKAVELGVTRIVPVQCGRSIVRLTAADAAKKTTRWNKIALAAAQQCGRGQIPAVSDILSFSAAVAEAARADIRLIPWEGERQCGIRAVLEADDGANDAIDTPGSSDASPAAPSISILIGPEGGFAANELNLAVRAGIRPVTLGPRILRTETAGAAVLAMLLYRYDTF
jgi:16S rRNA (uracil1498-N3)-methyltransferase